VQDNFISSYPVVKSIEIINLEMRIIMEISANQNQTISNALVSNLRFSLYWNRMLCILGHTWVVCLESSIGLHVGAAAGWITGWCIALIYRNFCEPMHSVSNAASSIWHYLPYEYSRFGLIAGAVLGTIIVLMLTLNKLTKPIETKGEGKEIQEK
jgi:hypothetical protein